MIRRSITAIMLVAMATCFGLGVNSALADDVVISSDITTSTLWSSEDTYYLDGIIFVTDGATLTIEPGTIVRGMPDSETSGNNNPGTLVVARGSKIFADGTSENPIVFTDMNDDNVPGGAKTNPLYNNNPTNMISENWGGVILLGATYLANDTESGPNAAREEQVEGIHPGRCRVFGGGDDDDSSGSMSYVSIRYGGYGLLENEEINGLTLGAVGRGTTLHHIEVANNVDDGIEFFGGTVNTKYIIIWNIGDDSMDSDEGYRGKSQFGLVVKGACKTGESGSGGGVGNNGFEMDGGNHPDQSRPYALSQWRNYTLIGMGAGTTDTASDADNGFEIRDNARPQIYHTIVMDMGGFAVDIEDLEDPAIDSAGGWTTAYNNYPDGASFYPTQQQGNQTEIADCLFYNTVGAVDNGGIGILEESKMNLVLASSPIQGIQRVNAPGYSTSLTIKMVSALDPRPTAIALDPIKELPTDGFFTPVDYYGAFSPAGNWADGWSLISSMGVLSIGSGQSQGFDEASADLTEVRIRIFRPTPRWLDDGIQQLWMALRIRRTAGSLRTVPIIGILRRRSVIVSNRQCAGLRTMDLTGSASDGRLGSHQYMEQWYIGRLGSRSILQKCESGSSGFMDGCTAQGPLSCVRLCRRTLGLLGRLGIQKCISRSRGIDGCTGACSLQGFREGGRKGTVLSGGSIPCRLSGSCRRRYNGSDSPASLQAVRSCGGTRPGF